MLANTYRRNLHQRAQDQYGFVTTRDARELGIPPVELRKLAARGGLTHVGRGVFRERLAFRFAPYVSDDDC